MTKQDQSFPNLDEILEDNPGWLDEAIDTPAVSQLTGVPTCTLTTWRVSRRWPPLPEVWQVRPLSPPCCARLDGRK